MSELDVSSLAELLDECRLELARAVDELEHARSHHRTVESLLLAVLEHVPVELVVLDAEGRVRAASAAAEAGWGAQLGDLAAGVEALSSRRIPDVCRQATEGGSLGPLAVPEGFGAAVTEEPGTGARYAVVWAAPAPG